jgi:hypothetical protein
MNEHDKSAFKQLMDSACEYYGKPPISPVALSMYFNGLADRSIEQVSYAFNQHVKDTEAGRFFPKIADFEKHLTAGELTPDIVLSAARNPKNIFGVRCRMHIGTFDLENCTDSFYLRQRAQECIDLCREWASEAAQGRFSQNLVDTFIKYQIDPRGPFRAGSPLPQNMEQINQQISMSLAESKRAKQLAKLEAPQLSQEQIEKNREKIQEIIRSI